jgi:hypothetical protein
VFPTLTPLAAGHLAAAVLLLALTNYAVVVWVWLARIYGPDQSSRPCGRVRPRA